MSKPMKEEAAKQLDAFEVELRQMRKDLKLLPDLTPKADVHIGD